MIDLVVLGTGNHDIVRLIETVNENKKVFNLVGFLEKNASKIGQSIFGYPIIGSDDLLLTDCKNCAVVNNIMKTPQIHMQVFNRVKEIYKIDKFPNIIHPSFEMKYVSIGIGNIIYENVHSGVEVTLGSGNIYYQGTLIGHEAKIGDCNLFAGNVTIGGRSVVGNCNLFGNSSVLSLGLHVGNDNFFGVGSVVIDNVKDRTSLLGNPAIDANRILSTYVAEKRKNRHASD